MSIIDKANELGKLIAESIELNNFKEAEEKYLNDLNLQENVEEYKNLYISLKNDNSDKMRQKVDDIYNKLLLDKNFSNYLETKNKLDNLMSTVNELINFYADYEKKGTCCKDKGNCDSCPRK